MFFQPLLAQAVTTVSEADAAAAEAAAAAQGMEISGIGIYAVLVTFGLTALMLHTYIRVDGKVENLKRDAMAASKTLRAAGMSDTADLLDNFVIDDKSGWAAKLRTLADRLGDPDALALALRTIVFKHLPVLLKNQEDRVLVRKHMAAAVAADGVQTVLSGDLPAEAAA